MLVDQLSFNVHILIAATTPESQVQMLHSRYGHRRVGPAEERDLWVAGPHFKFVRYYVPTLVNLKALTC